MIKLEKIKMILWDFDDTLCFHSDHRSVKDKFDTSYNIKVLSGKNAWENCRPNTSIKQFMHLAQSKSIRQGLISGCSSYVHMIKKQEWVYKHYNINLENFCVCSQDMKLGIIKAIAEVNNYKPEEILFVDDMWENLEKVADLGYQSCSPVEVINFLDYSQI